MWLRISCGPFVQAAALIPSAAQTAPPASMAIQTCSTHRVGAAHGVEGNESYCQNGSRCLCCWAGHAATLAAAVGAGAIFARLPCCRNCQGGTQQAVCKHLGCAALAAAGVRGVQAAFQVVPPAGELGAGQVEEDEGAAEAQSGCHVQKADQRGSQGACRGSGEVRVAAESSGGGGGWRPAAAAPSKLGFVLYAPGRDRDRLRRPCRARAAASAPAAASEANGMAGLIGPCFNAGTTEPKSPEPTKALKLNQPRGR